MMDLKSNMYRSCIILTALTLPVIGCSSSSTDGDGDTVPAITAANAETLLREVIAIANDDALDAASEDIEPVIDTVENLVDQAISSGAASGNGLTFMSTSPVNEGGELSEYTFSCDSGGTLVVQAYKDDTVGGPNIDEMRATDACSIDDAAYEGFAYKSVRYGRGTDLSNFEDFSIAHANGDSLLLNGEYYNSSADGNGPLVKIGWTDADLVRVEEGETTTIEDYTSLRESILHSEIPGVDSPGTTATVSFTVTAPWTSDEPLNVDLDLAYVDAEDSVPTETGVYPAQWQTGTLQITASDGSGLTLSPETDDAATFSVLLDSAEDDPMIFNWADGFQVLCAPEFECS